jgi:hypothetical protein
MVGLRRCCCNLNLTFKHDDFGNKFAVFEVVLLNKESVFMSYSLSKKSGQYAVVIVNSIKFLQLWRNDSKGIHKEIAFGTPVSWINDYKYEKAEKGFSYKYTNPVPLAYISCFENRIGAKKHQCVGFTNGVTRTIWLLSNGCKEFPVECELSEASALYNLAGVANSKFYTLEELSKIHINNPQ